MDTLGGKGLIKCYLASEFGLKQRFFGTFVSERNILEG